MVVGLAVWELMLPGCSSLKEKRQVVKSLKDRLHDRFNVSAAETDHHDVHQRAQIAAAVVSGDRKHAVQVLQQADRLVEEEGRARILDSYTTFY
ncbi:MAG TPA: DUF503 domain-containing protein [Longimicrobiaceae bacterium]|nr:DUF503 domain-containing protein [Longimicrobiaceae bacterium]